MRKDRAKKEKDSGYTEFDELDRKIIQALSEELSEIEVSEELIARTLCAAGKNAKGAIVLPHKNTRKREAYPYYFLGGTIAAAILLFTILGFSGQQGGQQDKANNEFFVQDLLSGASYQPDSISDGVQENKEMMDWAEAGSPVDAPKEEDVEEWLYQELLAVFKEDLAFSSDEKVNEETGKIEDLLLPEKNQKQESRRIVWQREGRVLTCVIYMPDYRIEALLQERDRTLQVSLEDFAYAKELWEFALDL